MDHPALNEAAPAPDRQRARRPIVLLGAAGAVGFLLGLVVFWLVIAGPPAPPPRVTVDLPKAPDEVPAKPAVATTLAPAPDPGLGETVPNLPFALPIVGADGRQPWQVYGRPFDPADHRPRIAFVIYNLATSVSDTDAVVRTMPAGVTLSFMPYRPKLPEWIAEARAAGHEVLLDLPMEPVDIEHQNPGGNALLTALDAKANLDRLSWVMSRATGYVGLMGYMGGRFESERADLQPVLQEVRRRGLLYVDNRASQQSAAGPVANAIGLPFAAAARSFDSDLTRALIERRLGDLEEIARRDGSAVGIGEAWPVLREALVPWAAALEAKGIALAPVSAVVAVGVTQIEVPPPPAPPAPPAAAADAKPVEAKPPAGPP